MLFFGYKYTNKKRKCTELSALFNENCTLSSALFLIHSKIVKKHADYSALVTTLLPLHPLKHPMDMSSYFKCLIYNILLKVHKFVVHNLVNFVFYQNIADTEYNG